MVNSSVRYGARIRKQFSAVKKDKIALYKCPSCGKISVEHISTGIWKCRRCERTFAGGAYTLTTPSGEASKRLIEGIKD